MAPSTFSGPHLTPSDPLAAWLLWSYRALCWRRMAADRVRYPSIEARIRMLRSSKAALLRAERLRSRALAALPTREVTPGAWRPRVAVAA